MKVLLYEQWVPEEGGNWVEIIFENTLDNNFHKQWQSIRSFMIVYLENPKDVINKSIVLLSEFSKVIGSKST